MPRFLAAVTLAFFPIFVANVVFTQRFKEVGDSTTAFGANLLGAMFGGLLEYAALDHRLSALLLLVAVLYGLAFSSAARTRAPRSIAQSSTTRRARCQRVPGKRTGQPSEARGRASARVAGDDRDEVALAGHEVAVATALHVGEEACCP